MTEEQKDRETVYVMRPFEFLLFSAPAEGSSFKGEQPLSAAF